MKQSPKEKAKELVDRIGNIQLYIDIEPRNIEGKIKYFDKDLIKEFSLIAVDEIVKSHTYGLSTELKNYWQEVKQELIKSE